MMMHHLTSYTHSHRNGPSYTHRHGSPRECLPQSDNVWSDPLIVTCQTSANVSGTHRQTHRWGGGIPFRVIGRKYTEGTNSRPHAYNTLSVYVHRGWGMARTIIWDYVMCSRANSFLHTFAAAQLLVPTTLLNVPATASDCNRLISVASLA